MTRRFRPCHALAPLTLALLAAHAAAQQPPTAAGDPAVTLDRLVVTGVRGTARSATETLAPVEVIGADEIARTGQQNLREALSALMPSYTDYAGFQNQHGLAVKTAGLRGLSGTKVLVLVNGRRRHASALINSRTGPVGADLDLIPTSAVKRIEVLRDGAAAQYGSDAIAGVINIILKDAGDGGSASLVYGQQGSRVGDIGNYRRTWQGFFNKGLKLGEDGGFLNLSADLSDRGWTAVTGAIPLSTRLYPLFNGQPDARETSLSRYRYKSTGLPESTTYNLGYNAELPLGGGTVLYSHGTVSNRFSQGWGGFRSAISSANNPAVYPDGYSIGYVVKEDDWQLVGGARGEDLAGWKWDASASWGRNTAEIQNRNSLNLSLGPTTPRDFVIGHQVYDEAAVNLDLTREVQTGWFSTPLRIAAGAELRSSTWKQTPGDPAAYADGGYILNGSPATPGAQGTYGYSPDVTGSYSRRSQALYGELGQLVTDRLELSAAARYEHYDDVSSVWSGKLAGRYELSSTLALRGAVNNGFAAPALSQQHYKLITRAYGVNPLTGVTGSSVQVSAPANDPAAIALGATALRPEKSRNVSAGIVFTPARDTTLTVDAYRIDIRDRILQSTTLQGAAVSRILAAAGLDSNQTVNYYTNAGRTQTTGLDLVAEHRSNYGEYGNVRWRLASNQRLDRIKQLYAAPKVLADAGVALIGRDVIGDLTDAYPKNVTSLAAQWTRGAWEVNAKATRYSSVVGRNAQSAARDQYVKPAVIFDLAVTYALTPKARFTVGAQNLFDKKPDSLTGDALTYATNSSGGGPYYSVYTPYGVNGGYYFARLDVQW
ncbi:TonB-dependent receptor plug domain-containing protein [Xylophilus sp.]|uniref:TonB-dependent receptor plug domain-containing protein n=1 Tax=Xylophilus sp. TaxID=2653893 RepID=UPI0013B938DC|nr:TonB-dependent receptor [Xylophilus sp.]KAF1050028.1 MAG: Colicin I receptor [Xylophilus sp.]